MQALRVAARQAAVAARPISVRRFGQVSEEQLLFGNQGVKGRVVEDWERVTYVTFAASLAVVTFGLAYAPRTSIKAWARDEAIARNNMEGTPEYGGQYAGTDGMHSFTKLKAGEMPKPTTQGGDEDEDE